VLDIVAQGVEKHFGEAKTSYKRESPHTMLLELHALELHAPSNCMTTTFRREGVLALALPMNKKCDTCVGDKYKVLMREDPEAEEQDARGGPRIAFEILPSAVVQMSEPPRWQRFAAGALLLFTAATALQIGLAANVSRLPKVPSPALPNGLLYQVLMAATMTLHVSRPICMVLHCCVLQYGIAAYN
jgi:hypothetical protein